MKIGNKLSDLYYYRSALKTGKNIDNFNINYTLDKTNQLIKRYKHKLKNILKRNKLNGRWRVLKNNKLKQKDIISVFESTLTRLIGINENELSEELIIVQTYYFDVIEDVIKNGFLYNNQRYICLTASAGQIRTKKTVFIKESTYKDLEKSITCDLDLKTINDRGGVNVNKYLAYLALTNSATDVWENFDIEKSIVVDDFETFVNAEVDFIDDNTYEITRQKMDIPITHTDGCGMILSTANKKNVMIRLPWVKGLMVVFPYDIFIKKINDRSKNFGIIKDIYGKEHDIIKENIKYIFTKSQFKMWKYYNSWEDYIEKFKKYNCQAGKCNEEEDEFNHAKINYQMLQTLSDMTEDELKTIAKSTIKDIYNISKDMKTMLKVLGATKTNKNKNYLQEAVYLYPELLNDTYCKEVLKQIKKSLVKDGKAGKLNINGFYTFLIPDLYAFCEYLFLKDKNPKGLLKNGEVYCNLFNNEVKLDCLRSPHLYLEHAIRKNTKDSLKKKWFVTNGIYTSCHDPISKILQFDNDGDKSLVCADETLVPVAERNMKNIVPLYYNMRKAEPQIINQDVIYKGLKAAYTGGNIGMYSNNITKIFNSGDITNNSLKAIKYLCMENNFVIDYAKTLYKPIRPKSVHDLITKFTKSKTPHFFIYAKNKSKNKVESLNNSTVNKLDNIIPNPRLKFKQNGFGNFDYTQLMYTNRRNINSDKAKEIIKKYTELDLSKRFLSPINDNDEDSERILPIYKNIREKILEVNSDIKYVTDILVKYLYEEKNSNYKTTLWSCFGDVIVENLKKNIDFGYTECKICHALIRKNSVNSKVKYCDECAKEINKKKTLENYYKNK